MWPERVSNPGPLTLESDTHPTVPHDLAHALKFGTTNLSFSCLYLKNDKTTKRTMVRETDGLTGVSMAQVKIASDGT